MEKEEVIQFTAMITTTLRDSKIIEEIEKWINNFNNNKNKSINSYGLTKLIYDEKKSKKPIKEVNLINEIAKGKIKVRGFKYLIYDKKKSKKPIKEITKGEKSI